MQARFLALSEIPCHASIPLYGTRAWLEMVAACVPYTLRVLGLEEAGTVVAWHPYLEVRRGPWKRALPLFIDTTGGPYYLPPDGLAFAEQSHWLRTAQCTLLAALAQNVDFATLCPLASDPRALPTTGDWKTRVRATARLDLNLEHPPWSAQALKKLRRARNKGLTFEPCPEPQRLQVAVENVTGRHGLGNATLSTDAFCALTTRLLRAGLLEGWCARTSDGLEVAYGLVTPGLSSDAVGYWYNLNTPEGLKLYASDFLFHSIAQAYRGRLRWFDLCGTDDANLIDFKEKWASETRYAFAYDYARRPWMRTALALFSRLRK
jgi:hypothetical protein